MPVVGQMECGFHVGRILLYHRGMECNGICAGHKIRQGQVILVIKSARSAWGIADNHIQPQPASPVSHQTSDMTFPHDSEHRSSLLRKVEAVEWHSKLKQSAKYVLCHCRGIAPRGIEPCNAVCITPSGVDMVNADSAGGHEFHRCAFEEFGIAFCAGSHEKSVGIAKILTFYILSRHISAVEVGFKASVEKRDRIVDDQFRFHCEGFKSAPGWERAPLGSAYEYKNDGECEEQQLY